MDSTVLETLFVVSTVISGLYFFLREKPVLKQMHKLERGVDYKSALPSLNASAQQQDSKAQFTLGMIYLGGQGIREDYERAVSWLTKAALSGNAAAQYNLGVLYARGKVLRQDYVQAYKWFTVAKTVNEADAGTYQEAIAREMSPEQIAEGQRLAAEWKPKAAA